MDLRSLFTTDEELADLENRDATTFIDVPMESYGQVTPLCVAVQNGSPDILHIMLRYGASIEDDKLSPAPIEILLSVLNEYEDVTQCPSQMLTCLTLLLRTIPTVCVQVPSHVTEACDIRNVSVYEQYPNLASKNLLPPERSGICPPELRHLCRCCIRQCLFENWALPHGIKKLPIPSSLQNYLDLLTD